MVIRHQLVPGIILKSYPESNTSPSSRNMDAGTDGCQHDKEAEDQTEHFKGPHWSPPMSNSSRHQTAVGKRGALSAPLGKCLKVIVRPR